MKKVAVLSKWSFVNRWITSCKPADYSVISVIQWITHVNWWITCVIQWITLEN